MTGLKPITLTIASNQGEFGGGEVMLISIAEAARDLGYDVTIVAPATPSDVVEQAQTCGFDTVAIPSDSRTQYLANLKKWDLRHRKGLLWCNGLRPALATAGHRNRIVHLHQQPQGRLSFLASFARVGALATVVPSQFLADRIPGSIALWNWTPHLPTRTRETRVDTNPLIIGYLGRLSQDKGVDILCQSIGEILPRGLDVKLLVAGESRFVAHSEARDIQAHIQDLGERA